jgi:hypothetical protein
MVRNDFVSNSSSSSFIVHADDNINGLLWHNLDDIRICDINTVVDCIYGDSLGICYLSTNIDIDKFKFISDVQFSKDFSKINTRTTFPNSCRELMEMYLKYHKDYYDMVNVQKLNYKNKKYETNYHRRQKIAKQIKAKILKALQLDWKCSDFHMITIDNNYIESMYDTLKVESNVDIFKNRIDVLTNNNPLKFYHVCD